jgi:Flp pilus assembly protein TadD
LRPGIARSPFHPLLVIAFVFVSPVIIELLTNPSDALFAAMSALSLWQVLLFYQGKALRNLSAASAFVGLAALSRNDGLILFVVFALVGVMLLCLSGKRVAVYLLGCVLPFAAIVGGYVLLYGVRTGSFDLGTGHRTYAAFEQGQGVAYSHLYEAASPFIEGQIEARHLYGSPEENSYSVLAAIRRNPQAFIQRVIQVAKNLPLQAVTAYGLGIGVIVLLLAARGMLHIIEQKEFIVGGIMLLWIAPLVVYFVTFFRPGYLLLPFFVVFSVGSIGVAALLHDLQSRSRRILWSTVLLGFAVYGIVKTMPNLFVATGVFLLGLWLVWILLRWHQDLQRGRLFGLAALFCVGLVVGADYPHPEFRVLGVAPDERAVLFMRERMAPGSRVASFAPGSVWVAKMDWVPITSELRSRTSGDELLTWMTENKVSAIYVDNRLRNNEPATLKLMEGLVGDYLDIGFSSGGFQVLLAAGQGLQQPLQVDSLGSGSWEQAQVLVARGNEQMAQGAWELAAESYRLAVAEWPDWGLAHTKLGNAYRNLGRMEEAEASYLRSMEVEPGYVGAYINLGGIYEQQGRDQEALEMLQTAVDMAPDSAWAHSALGSVCFKMGDSVAALAHLERAVELEPENVTWLLFLADCYLGLGRHPEAVAAYQRVLDLDPGNQRATNALEELEP